MKTEHLENLKTSLAACERLESAIAADEKRHVSAAAELETLMRSVDLEDSAGLNRLTQLQVIATIAPVRREAKAAELDAARANLVQLNHRFIHTELVPRCKSLREKASAKVRNSLKPHYENEIDLGSAINDSKVLGSLAKIEDFAVIRGFSTRDAQTVAAGLISAWGNADAFEKSHLS